eukprot:5379126-Lingulodinium_polyedra.AAC.1
MLAWGQDAYAAHGMFVQDAAMSVAAEGLAGLQSKVLSARPRFGAKLSCFGWEADGAVVNS